MGDRINLRFVDSLGNKSPVLYAHWAGTALLEEAQSFWDLYKDKVRHEPSNWMVNFICMVHGHDPYDGNYYLYNDFDCSADDNGDWEFNTDTGECIKVSDGYFDSSEYKKGDLFNGAIE